jgi:hypothetical protein
MVLLVAGPAAAGSVLQQLHGVKAVDAMMVALASNSARASARIRGAYHEHLDLLMLAGYTDIEGALDNGGLVPLPAEPSRFNLMPRLDGPHPIGEKDLDNQASYIAARPATIGMLLDIASRVKSGPLEITSLVRHGEYQESLRTTNANANTSVPMHTMGLAVDIALVNSSLETVYEIRDVLQKMQRQGDILFIGERRQLVFHVVPHPSRLGHFTDLYIRKVGLPPTSRSAHVVAAAPVKRTTGSQKAPSVTAEVLAVVPLAARGAPPADEPGANDTVAPVPVPATAMKQAAASAGRMLRRGFILFAALLGVVWHLAARPAVRPELCRIT